ncbi:MAG: helix-turn-helix domain-containing protein [Lysobacter sp.]|nr:helix-turn-helix domain-containing protein [Lysobacter sp.]
MDSLISAAARALAAGDALAALKRVALRDDPPALALRGIALAQLGEHPRARELLKRAARGFGAHEALARARCVVAEAEVALAMRDFAGSPRALDTAMATLAGCGDAGNALQARLIAARRQLLLGRLDEAAATLAPVHAQPLPPLPGAVAALLVAELALRSLRMAEVQTALARAGDAVRRAGVPALQAEVTEALALLERPAARRLAEGRWLPLRLQDVAELLDSGALVVDACRHGLRAGAQWLPLARRPILFTLAALMAGLAGVEATARGFVLKPADGRPVAVLAPPIDGDQGDLIALLSDGAAWSTSALALALGTSQRNVQRALAELEAAGRVRASGQTRARRWLAPPLTGFTTILLLPAALPLG